MPKKRIAFIVPETHWDREWYSTFQQFRWRLVKLTDKLLNILDTDPAYEYFTFDGQTVVLEDYLEIRPHEREHLARYVKEGRLVIGPWYILPDEFLVSGEALVRNLLIGQLIAEDFGRSMKVGYTPDPFGHLAQLPAILLGFGLDNAILMRGLGGCEAEEDAEIWWEGLDGSRVLLLHQRNSYCNLSSLGLSGLWTDEKPDMDKAHAKIREQADSLAEHSKTPYVLLNNGCDHVDPQRELPQVLEYARERIDDVELRHATFEHYVDAVREHVGSDGGLGVVKGELHGARLHPILSGVWSTRIYLKQWNNRVQNLLERFSEPTAVAASLLGRRYDREYLRFAWKRLLLNHPHDSICGCSIDQVHAEMLPRFAEAEQVGELIASESLAHIAKFVNTQRPNAEGEYRPLLVFNPHGWNLSGIATLAVKMGLPAGERPKSVRLVDANGKRVPCQLTNQSLTEFEDGVPWAERTWRFDLLIAADDVPAMGYKTYFADWGKVEPTTRLLIATPTTLENRFLRVQANPNGTIDITDNRSGALYAGCLLLEDTEDCGDEYDWSPAHNSRTITSTGVASEIALIEDGPVRSTLRIAYDLSLPESLTEDRLGRSSRSVLCRVAHEVSLGADTAQVDVRTTFDNQAKDHRLRVHLPAPLAVNQHVAETAFGVIERPNQPPRVTNWVQMPQPTYAQRTWAAVEDGRIGLAVANNGLPEYQVVEASDGVSIALTLLRAVGWLSRGDYITRPYNAGPPIPTPEAQCLDTYQFEYTIMPYVGEWERSKVWQTAHLLNTPFRVMEQTPHDGDLAAQFSLFEIEAPEVALSALKMAERTDNVVLRVYNTCAKPVKTRIATPLNVRDVRIVNLNEAELSGTKITREGNNVTLSLSPFEIVSLSYDVSL